MRRLKICPNLGCPRQAEQYEYAWELDFCTQCGTKLEQGLGAYCTGGCKNAVKSIWNYCGHCGNALKRNAMFDQRDREAADAKQGKS